MPLYRGSRRLILQRRVTATTTLDPANKGTNLTLAPGNLRVTNSVFSFGNVRSIASHSAGLLFFEVLATTADYQFDSIGIANSAEVLNGQYAGQTFDSVGYHFMSTAEVRINAAALSGGSGWPANSNGATIAVAVNIPAMRIWFKSTAVTNWNNNGSADPATNVGGLDISTLNAGPYFAFLCLAKDTPDDYTANFGATAYTFAKPATFLNW